MRKFSLIILLIIKISLLTHSYSQATNPFVVVYVYGHIFNLTHNRMLQPNDTLIGSEKLQFFLTDSYAAVSPINKPALEYIAWQLDKITPQKIEFFEALRINPAQWKARAKDYIPKGTVLVADENYSINTPDSLGKKGGYYFYSYRVKDHVLEKTLPQTTDNRVLLTREKLFGASGYFLNYQSVYEGTLYFFDTLQKNMHIIQRLKPVYLPGNELETLISPYQKILQKNRIPAKKQKAAVEELLVGCFGQLDKNTFNQWWGNNKQ